MARSRGLCSKHYTRLVRNGDPMRVRDPLRLAPIEEKFWSRVDFREECWLWTGSKNNIGYGMFQSTPGINVAHRWSWAYFGNCLPKGLELDHLCRNRACVRPDHLEPVSHRENVLRGVGPSANHAQKTECPRGHKYDHVSYGKRTTRRCRTCDRVSWHRRQALKRSGQTSGDSHS